MAQRTNAFQGGPAPTALLGLSSGASWAAGLLWLAAGLSAGYWLLQVSSQGGWTPVQGMAPSVPQADTDSVARALGAFGPVEQGAAPAAPSRLRLLGVIVQGASLGAALIAVDGQPARPWQVGAAVAEGLVLQSIDQRSVRLGESRSGATTMELKVPPLPNAERPGAAG